MTIVKQMIQRTEGQKLVEALINYKIHNSLQLGFV
jgi:hypothetical protein